MEPLLKVIVQAGAICLFLNACGGGSHSETTTINDPPQDGTFDPLYSDQWHLDNTLFAGEDINVLPVWSNPCGSSDTCRGEDIRIAVVDDGLEINHPDLLANITLGLSHNYLNNSSDPTPNNPNDGHGTSVAGIIAARDYNDEGVRGVAPRANLVGYNVLSNLTIANAADALTRGSPNVHVSSNSWGAPDNTGLLDELPLAWKTAIDTGLSSGRQGRGTIYVWAAGNGGYSGFNSIVDNSNYDGQANYRGVIAVAAINNAGRKSFYSEEGANILISAPAGETCDSHAITSTDLTANGGLNYIGTPNTNDYSDRNYTKCMSGTSAATPVVSGAVALMLQANPALGWRDVRYILATTARKNHSSDITWTTNGATYPVNHKYGFGVVDTAAAVTKAKGWANLGPQLVYTTELKAVNAAIPDNNIAISSSIIVPGNPGGITKIEAIEIIFSANHEYSGDLAVTLTSPGGTESILADTHLCDGSCSQYNAWNFSSVRHLDEAAGGTWTLSVKDGEAALIGTFDSWQLKIYGY